MAAYAIFQINVKNPEEYKGYLNQVTPIVRKYNGEYIVRGGESEVVWGEWAHPRTVIIKFPSYEVAVDWDHSEEYDPVKKIREDNAEGNCLIIKGG